MGRFGGEKGRECRSLCTPFCTSTARASRKNAFLSPFKPRIGPFSPHSLCTTLYKSTNGAKGGGVRPVDSTRMNKQMLFLRVFPGPGAGLRQLLPRRKKNNGARNPDAAVWYQLSIPSIYMRMLYTF